MLQIENLAISVRQGQAATCPVRGVTFKVSGGEIVGLMGESGSGKSLTARAVLRLLPPGARVEQGQILWKGTDLLSLPRQEIHRKRGREIGLMFQEPASALNRVMTVEAQITEGILWHFGIDRQAARERAAELLSEVGLSSPGTILASYPFQLSGGQRQRVLLAATLACEPELLIADEPTSSLDPTLQLQILRLLRHICSAKKISILLISHDLLALARTCDRIDVLHDGRIVESAPPGELTAHPIHSFTRRVVAATPGVRPAWPI